MNDLEKVAQIQKYAEYGLSFDTAVGLVKAASYAGAPQKQYDYSEAVALVKQAVSTSAFNMAAGYGKRIASGEGKAGDFDKMVGHGVRGLVERAKKVPGDLVSASEHVSAGAGHIQKPMDALSGAFKSVDDLSTRSQKGIRYAKGMARKVTGTDNVLHRLNDGRLTLRDKLTAGGVAAGGAAAAGVGYSALRNRNRFPDDER